MTLGEKQNLFSRLLVQLMSYAHTLGYEIRIGDVYRSREECTRLNKPNSVHNLKIAADLNLFKDGVYLTATEDHRVLGMYWKSLNPLCRWGGDFRDGNHYSIEHEGVK
jgi:hypothetical protein